MIAAAAPPSRVLLLTALTGVVLAFSACDDGSADVPDTTRSPATAEARDHAAPADTTPTAPRIDASVLVDRDIPPAVAGEEGWDYQLSTTADFDGDGQAERAVITARVEMVRGQPAWDDGQPWQVYVEEADGTRTYIYAQRLQLGPLVMRVTLAEDSGRPAIVLLEHLPDRIRLFEAEYGGPSDVSVSEVYNRRLDPAGELASPHLP